MRLIPTARRCCVKASLGVLLSLLPGPRCGAQVWTSIGPAPVYYSSTDSTATAGRVTSIAVDPGDATHWLIGAATGGVWESRDSGASWTPRTDTQPTLATGSIAFVPSNPKVIYVGTGEANFTPWTMAGLGILQSLDGGSTWRLLGASTFAHASVGALRVHPANPNIVLAGSARGYVGKDSGFLARILQQFGIYKSNDGGVTWVRTLTGEISALETDPTNFAINMRRSAILSGRRPFLFSRRWITVCIAPPIWAKRGIRSTGRGPPWPRCPGGSPWRCRRPIAMCSMPVSRDPNSPLTTPHYWASFGPMMPGQPRQDGSRCRRMRPVLAATAVKLLLLWGGGAHTPM